MIINGPIKHNIKLKVILLKYALPQNIITISVYLQVGYVGCFDWLVIVRWFVFLTIVCAPHQLGTNNIANLDLHNTCFIIKISCVMVLLSWENLHCKKLLLNILTNIPYACRVEISNSKPLGPFSLKVAMSVRPYMYMAVRLFAPPWRKLEDMAR